MKAISTNTSKKILGTVLLFGSVIFTSSSQVYYGMFIQSFSPYLFLFISFSFSTVFFHIMDQYSSKKRESTHPIAWKDILILNVLTAIIFICFYIALKYVEPAVVSSIEWGIGPVIALLFFNTRTTKNKLGPLYITSGVGVLIGSLFLAWTSLNGGSGILITSHNFLFIGLIFSFLTGVGNICITYFSKKLSEQGFDASKVLAHRFYLIILISAIMVLYEKSYLSIQMTDMIGITIITITGTILPMYFIQSSLKYSSAFSVLIVSSLVPCATYLFQLFDPRINLSYFTLIGVMIITIFGFLAMFEKDESEDRRI